MEEKVAHYKDDFDLFPTADEKIEYIVDLGKNQPPLKPGEKNDESYIKGCSSNAWLIAEFDGNKIHFKGEGESMMAKGMMTILLNIFNDRTPQEILSFDPKLLQTMGITELLSPVRQQGLEVFLNTIYTHAKAYQKGA
ncbi:MAG: SufE family protein [Campylobacterales bacterium]|nr:SufE family protein [Campylobacterales bacterium]